MTLTHYISLFFRPAEQNLNLKDLFLEKTDAAIPLAHLPAGEEAYLINLSKGIGFIGRLTSLGFTPGVEIHMLQNAGHGPILVSIRGTRVALGRNEAGSILVKRGKE